MNKIFRVIAFCALGLLLNVQPVNAITNFAQSSILNQHAYALFKWNHPPKAASFYESVCNTKILQSSLIAVDPDCDRLIYSIIAGMPNPYTQGTLILDYYSGKFTFTPVPGYVGTISFVFQVTDGRCKATQTGTIVVIQCTPPDKPNTTQNITWNTTGNTTGNITCNTTSNTTGNITWNTTDNTTSNTTGNITWNTTDNTTSNTTGNITWNTTDNTTSNTTGNITWNTTGNTTSNTTGNTTSNTTDNTTDNTTSNTTSNTTGNITCNTTTDTTSNTTGNITWNTTDNTTSNITINTTANTCNTTANTTCNPSNTTGNITYDPSNTTGNITYDPSNTTGNITYDPSNTTGNITYDPSNTTGNITYDPSNTTGNVTYDPSNTTTCNSNSTTGNTTYNPNSTYNSTLNTTCTTINTIDACSYYGDVCNINILNGQLMVEDSDGKPLTYRIVSGMPDPETQGTLILDSSDGKFVFTPVGNYVGKIDFIYEVTNGETTVQQYGTINVKDCSSNVTCNTTHISTINTTQISTIDTTQNTACNTTQISTINTTQNTTCNTTQIATINTTQNTTCDPSNSTTNNIYNSTSNTTSCTTINTIDAYSYYGDICNTSVLSGQLVAEDSDGKPLTYTIISGMPDPGTQGILSLDSSNGKFVFTPVENYVGKIDFIYKVTDGETSVQQCGTINVKDCSSNTTNNITNNTTNNTTNVLPATGENYDKAYKVFSNLFLK